ncbi:phosphoribosylamine--glycine ligase [Dongia mobilis]|uniref:Phosphoribosylamine--glycine ligase n=1 Tax=Dongia mobilis TaxID=578943 RepID=A0A4R6WPK4_9PROT|nr:phosphoribosylamine--glycine ligase [Dongia mobilis]TDQ81051.1 phosphoribosylamine--glycine ligase [Dongia mobilis]
MRILVVGSGGREHALCWKIAASPLCDKLYCAPGNAGIAAEAECVAIGVDDIPGLVKFAREKAIDLVVVGPEAPLVAGLADALEAAGIPTFGPSAKAAELEGSKGFMKDLAAKYAVPTAAYRRFRAPAPAKAFAATLGLPVVIKADGLAAGKGVVIAQSRTEAEAAIDAMMTDRQFGEAGAELVVEEFLQGEELSFFALCDGAHAIPLASAQDHKQVGDGDTGPNTGGMGAYSPAPVATPEIERRIMEEIIRPTVQGMAAEGRPFKGVLFAGIMVTEGGPKLIEFNVRFGDPECEVLMLRLKSDLVPALIAARDGTLKNFDLRWFDDAALCVVMAAKGYPGRPETGTVIGGLDAAATIRDVAVFHAGTKQNDKGEIVAAGGRVLAVAASARDVASAQALAYQAVDAVQWPGGFCRRDIGWRALARGK